MAAPEFTVELVEAPEFTVELVGSLIVHPDSQWPVGGVVGQALILRQQSPQLLEWGEPEITVNDLVLIFNQNLI